MMIATNGTTEEYDVEKGTLEDIETREEAATTVEDQDTMKPPATRRCRSKACMLAASIGVCIFIIGLIGLILNLTGFFTVEEPCVDVQSFVISNLELVSSEEAANNNPVLGFVDSLTGGLASSLIPTQVKLNLALQLQVNNTNPFKLEYAQMNDATINIPEYLLTNAAPTDGPVISPNDFQIGTWQLPDGTLESRSSSIMPVTVSANIDLSDTATLQLAPVFLQGGAMAFLIEGGIRGSTWVPFVSGDVNFLCLAQIDNILQLDEGAKVRCRTSIKVGDFINKEGEINLRRLQSFMDQPANPACYV
jgi:hypothetical protein